jgi:2'-5' RNA ligase
VDAPGLADRDGLERFRSIQWLHNHWARPAGPRAYYWYLTFEDSPALHSLARECQDAIAFPYYDLTPVPDLHLTLDRIAFDGAITPDQLAAIEAAAIDACRKVAPFPVTVGALGGTRGAIGFTAFPVQPVRDLRDALRAATLSVCPQAPVRRSEFHPHVAIAYANSDGIPAAEAIAAVEKLHATARAEVTVTDVALVLLERRQRSYAWHPVARIPLAG